MKKRFKIIAVLLFVFAASFILLPFVTSPHGESYFISTENTDKMIALTFDDGPGEHTVELLNGLEKLNAKASFFLLGKNIEKNADTVKEIHSGGHLIGSHTYSHKTLYNSSFSEFEADLQKANELIECITGEDVMFFRPPHGHYTGRQLNKIEQISVLWSNDPADWKHLDSDYVYEYLIKHAGDGKIFLLHDTKKTTVDGVLKAIAELTEQGFKFVRADELLCRNGDGLKFGLAYRGCKNSKPQFYF